MHPEAGAQLAVRLPKGHSPVTAELVLDALADADAPRSASEVAANVGISRWTAQRYLTTLAELGLVQMQPQYGTNRVCRSTGSNAWSAHSRATGTSTESPPACKL